MTVKLYIDCVLKQGFLSTNINVTARYVTTETKLRSETEIIMRAEHFPSLGLVDMELKKCPSSAPILEIYFIREENRS